MENVSKDEQRHIGLRRHKSSPSCSAGKSGLGVENRAAVVELLARNAA